MPRLLHPPGHWPQQLPFAGTPQTPKVGRGRKSLIMPSSRLRLVGRLSVLPTSSHLPGRQLRSEQRADHARAVLRDETSGTRRKRKKEACPHKKGLCVLHAHVKTTPSQRGSGNSKEDRNHGRLSSLAG